MIVLLVFFPLTGWSAGTDNDGPLGSPDYLAQVTPSDPPPSEGAPGEPFAETKEEETQESFGEKLDFGESGKEEVLDVPDIETETLGTLQEERDEKIISFPMSVGMGFGMINVPIEKDMDGRKTPIDLYFDGEFLEKEDNSPASAFRIGLNRAEGEIPGGIITTTAIYTALRQELSRNDTTVTYLLVGLAWLYTNVKGIQNLPQSKDTGIGIISGLGAMEEVGSLRMGAQVVMLRRHGNIGLAPFVIGSNQFQMFLEYPFH